MFFTNPLFTASDSSGSSPSQYTVARSVRFTYTSNQYFSRSFPSSPADTSTTIKTFSMWAKRSTFSSAGPRTLCGGSLTSAPTSNFWKICLETTQNVGSGGAVYNAVQDCLVLYTFNGSMILGKTTVALFRDISAWYHIVVAMDTTQSVAEDRFKLYVNGSRITSFNFNTIPAQNNANCYKLAGCTFSVGTLDHSVADQPYDGYIAEFRCIDGQALGPTSFATTNSTTGQWIPIQYAGTYGNNGFYLDFSDNSSTTNLGLDRSGNGKNFTPNSFSVTAGTANDSVFDSPTEYSDGTYIHGNYPTLNPLDTRSLATLSAGNLTATSPSAAWRSGVATMSFGSGKIYFETTAGGALYNVIGVCTQNSAFAGSYPGADAVSWGYGSNPASKIYNGTATTYGTPQIAAGSVLMCAVDIDNGKIFFGINGSWAASADPVTGANPAFTGVVGPITPAVGSYNSTTSTVNFGQKPFAYTPPTGYVAVCGYNIPSPAVPIPSNVTKAQEYTGAASAQSITTAFQPDFLWIKSSAAVVAEVFDSTRGNTLALPGDATAETTISGVTLNTNGFSVPANTSSVSGTGTTYHSLCLKKGSTNGFDVISWTGDGNTTRLINHSLGAAPEAGIFRARTGSTNWYLWHKDMASNTTFNVLQGTAAETTSGTPFGTGTWSSTQFMVGTGGLNTNGVGYIGYLFRSINGLLKIGTITTTASQFIELGFRPAFIFLKPNGTNGSFCIEASTVPSGSPILNVTQNQPYWMAAGADSANGSTVIYDTLANGFKSRWSYATAHRYIAFADTPFKYARAR